MTRDESPLPICPRCRGEDVATIVLEHYATGDRIVLHCDGCGAGFQQWLPRPAEPADPGAWVL